MVQAIVKWVTRTGHRFTSSADTLSVDVLAYTNIATEGDIASVSFVVNGGSPQVVSSRSKRTPNYNQTPSPRTGTSSMADIDAFGITIAASAYSAGPITITATATSTLGTVTALPGSIVIYNDKTGDTRPSVKTIYVNADSGNDSAVGSAGAPVLSIQKAFELVATSGDMGGGEVVLQPSTAEHLWCRGYGGVADLHTSGHWWVTLRVQAGARITRPGAYNPNGGGVAYTPGPDDLYLRGQWNGSAYTGAVRLLMVLEDPVNKQVSRGDLKFYSATGVETHLATEGGVVGDPDHGPTNRWSVTFTENGTGLFDQVNQANTTTYRHATNVRMQGVTNAFFGYRMTHDCVVEDFTAIAYQTTSYDPQSSAINCTVATNRYNHEVSGLVDCVLGGKAEVIKIGSTMRIRQLSGQVVHPISGGSERPAIDIDIAQIAQRLTSSLAWGVRPQGWLNPGNNSTQGFPVLAVGYDGGRPYIDLDNPNAVSETAAGSGVSGPTIWTARKDVAAGSFYVDAVHPDVWQMWETWSDALVYGMRVPDVTGSRIWASSNSSWTRVAFVNCGDTFTNAVSDLSPPSMTDCLFFHCTFSAAANWGTSTVYSGCEVRNCVFDRASNAPTSGVAWDGNHFRDGIVTGSSTSTGAWFANDPLNAPFHLTPLVSNQGTAPANDTPFATTYVWPAAGGLATRGVWRDVGENTQSAIGAVTGSGAAVLPRAIGAGTANRSATVAGAGAATLPRAIGQGVVTFGAGITGSGAATWGPAVGAGSIVAGGTLDRTHYYHIVGDVHVRGVTTAFGGPEILAPGGGGAFAEQKLTVLVAPTPAAKVGDVVTGGTSGARMMLTRIIAPEVWVGEPLPAAAPPALVDISGGAFSASTAGLPFTGEVVTVLSADGTSRTANVSFVASGQSLPQFNQFLGTVGDATLGALVPEDGSDATFWYQKATPARNLSVDTLSGTAPYFRKGDRITSSAGGSALIKLVVVQSPTEFDLRLVQVSGTFAPGNTITNATITGGATASAVSMEGELSEGGWWPFSAFPNLRSFGTFFESQPQGNSASGGDPTLGIASRLVALAHSHHQQTPSLNDRGVRVVDFIDVESGSGSGRAGVLVQVVACTGTFPSSWTIGEQLTSSSSDWTGVLLGYNATQKELYVRDVNGEVLKTGTITGATSSSTATNDGAAYGWQKGSRYFEGWKANLTKAIAAPNARFADSPVQHEGVVFMPWMGDMRCFGPQYACPFPTNDQATAAFSRCVADMRDVLGDNNASVPFVFWKHRLDALPQIAIPTPFGPLPVAYLMRIWVDLAAAVVPNATAVDAQVADTELGPNTIFLRPLDYPDKLAPAFWKHLRFGQISVPAGTGHELLPVGIHTGQSRMVGGIPAAISTYIDPESFPATNYLPGVSSVDPNSMVWNARTQKIEPAAADINLNTFWGSNTNTSGPEVTLQARMKMRFSSSASASSKFCLFKVPVGASAKASSTIGALGCWDPELTSRPAIGPTCTVTVQPGRGRFTATPGTFQVGFWLVGMSATISGSGSNLPQGGGGNDTVKFTTNGVADIAPDGSWIEFSGNFVPEGPRTFTLSAGPPPIWPQVVAEWRAFVNEANRMGYIPIPVYHWDDQSDSDLFNASEYASALDRFWDAAEQLFGKKLKGQEPIAKLITLQPTTTPIATDEQITIVRNAQIAKAASLVNCKTLEISDLPFEVNNGQTVRLERQDQGIHLTPIGQLTHGLRADQVLGSFGPSKGIPPHPAGELSGALLGAINGGVIATGTTVDKNDNPEIEEGGTEDLVAKAAVGTLTGAEVDQLLQQIESGWANGTDVLSYTVNGQSVVRNSPQQLIELHRYLSSIRQRAAGVRRTRARFN